MNNVFFIHNLKAGGTSVQKFIKDRYNLKELKRIKINRLYVDDRKRKRRKNMSNPNTKIIMNIRNPYDHYISLYTYGPSVFNNALNIHLHKKLGFTLFIKKLLKLELKDSNYQEEKVMKKYNIGLISARVFIAIYGEQINNINKRKLLLKKLNYGCVNEFIKVEDIPIKLHVRNHNIDYNKYYDQELIDLVYAKDSLIFKYFNYPKLELS